jgi:hypothetical protein
MDGMTETRIDGVIDEDAELRRAAREPEFTPEPAPARKRTRQPKPVAKAKAETNGGGGFEYLLLNTDAGTYTALTEAQLPDFASDLVKHSHLLLYKAQPLVPTITFV